MARNADIANQALIFGYAMKDRSVPSCTVPEKQLPLPISTDGYSTELYINSLKEITKISSASSLIHLHEKAATDI